MLVLAGQLGSILTGEIAEAANGDHLDRSRLVLTLNEDFDAPVSFWDPKSGNGFWKTCYWFGWQPPRQGCIDKSSRTMDGDGSLYVLVDPPYNGVNPFGQREHNLTIMVARNASPEDPKSGGRPYTAGIITSEPSFSQLYGYFEIGTQLPEGRGLWPAFWMLPASHSVPFELDVMENLGRDPNVIYCTAHWGDGTEASFPVKVDGVQRHHSYGAFWSREEIVWYVDDVEVARTPNKDLHTPMYLIAGIGVGGAWGGDPDAKTRFPAQMVIDYVRVYRTRP